MTDPTTSPEPAEHEDPPADGDAEEVADRELPLDPAGPTELGGAVDG